MNPTDDKVKQETSYSRERQGNRGFVNPLVGVFCPFCKLHERHPSLDNGFQLSTFHACRNAESGFNHGFVVHPSYRASVTATNFGW